MSDTKRERLRRYLDREGLASVWFARPNSFAWLTGGDNVVDREGDVGVAAVGTDGDGLTVVTTNIEAPRMRAEEMAGVECEVVEYPWYEGGLGQALAERGATPAAADFEVPGFDRVDARSLRQPLTEADVEAYRDLGRDAAEVVESVARAATPDETEAHVADALRFGLLERGIECPVALVGGERRAQVHRHYTPQDERLGGYALLSVTAQRDGLHTSLTRTVAFDPPEWLESRHAAATRVDTTALAATREAAAAGGTAGDVFEAIQDAYAATGHDGEWEHHHQGGAAGFDGREWIATPGGTETVRAPMAYAWNPTVQGAKSEDTVLVTEDGFETLTTTGEWPTTTVEAVDRDLELDRHGVLHVD